MTIQPLALVVCILGAILYAVPAVGGKVNEIGRIMFAFGLLVLLLNAGGHGGLRIG